MAAGWPVIAAMNLDGDGPRLIAEARCGLCVLPEDPQALAEAILQLYYNASLREELGRNGRRYAEEHFSLDRCVVQCEALAAGGGGGKGERGKWMMEKGTVIRLVTCLPISTLQHPFSGLTALPGHAKVSIKVVQLTNIDVRMENSDARKALNL